MVEILLQLFIGKVDAELLKTVHFEILETENVQNSYNDKIHRIF